MAGELRLQLTRTEQMIEFSILRRHVAAAAMACSREARVVFAHYACVPMRLRMKAAVSIAILFCAAQFSLTISTRAEAAAPTAKVRMYFNIGPVEIELYGNESPLNVANFLSYVDAGTYDDSFIHRTRASNPSQPFGYDLFAQGGSFKYPVTNIISSNPITPGSPVVNEFNAGNGLTNKPGSLAAARSTNPNSATSGWFINQSNNSASFDPGPYTVLGQVTSGLGVINQIPFLPNAPGLSGSAFESTPFYQNDLVVIERVARIPILAGDYNFDGTVNAADYNLWKADFGSTTKAEADGNGDGIVNAADYTIWRNFLGTVTPPGSGSGGVVADGVPEPTTMLLLALAGGLLVPLARHRDRARG